MDQADSPDGENDANRDGKDEPNSPESAHQEPTTGWVRIVNGAGTGVHVALQCERAKERSKQWIVLMKSPEGRIVTSSPQIISERRKVELFTGVEEPTKRR